MVDKGQGYDLSGFTLIEEDNRRMGTYLNRNQNNNGKSHEEINTKDQGTKRLKTSKQGGIKDEDKNRSVEE
nr:hypothetical protein [Tanacetum cinerariifolium]